MIFIDTVYQRVLALANKEQRGYITPLEFNLIANQAQMAIFEQYFYDLNQFKRDPNDENNDPNTAYEARKVDDNEARFLMSSRFHRRGLRRHPIYIQRGAEVIVYNHQGPIIAGIFAENIRRPNRVEWGYNIVAEKALYNASSTTDFELHESEENNVVVRILELAGVTINKAELVAWSAQQEAKEIQQQKS
jgi:hypothetical protein